VKRRRSTNPLPVEAAPAPGPGAAADPAQGALGPIASIGARIAGQRATMRRDSIARLAADGFALATSIVTASLTAHALGPAGKGYFSTLTLLATLFVVAFEVGIGDAMIVLVGQGRAKLRQAARATMQATLGLAAGATIAFLAVAALVFGPIEGDEVVVLALGAALVAVGVWYSTLASFLLSVQRVALVAGLAALGAAATTVVFVALAIGSRLDLQGAVAAGLAGTAVGALGSVVAARRAGIALRPGRERGYIGEALRLGVGFQVPSLLVVAASRLDLLLVYALGGDAAAGTYSVALTIGALVVSIPTAVAYAAFPRLSRMDDAQARALTAKVLRHGMLGALASAVVLAALTPVAVPFVFGERFEPAVEPTLVLLLAALPWSAQWLLARCASARGATRMLVVSFGVGFALMIGLDIVLIPDHGDLGAAVAALASATVGAAVAGVMHAAARRRRHTPRA
jgi:O-antigen/teichoic acid export membrane protein